MRNLTALIVLLYLSGCATISPKKIENGAEGRYPQTESSKEVEEAVGSVISSVSGKDISPDEMKKLVGQLRRDGEAKEAVEAITQGLIHKGVKYCPVTGKRYSPQSIRCPIHDVPLEWVEE